MFYFYELQLPTKISKESVKTWNSHKLFFFLQKGVRIFSDSVCWNFDLCPSPYSLFLTGIQKGCQKGNKNKTEESRTRFCRQIIQPWPHQISKRLKEHSVSWSSWKILRLIFCKNPGHQTYFNVVFKLVLGSLGRLPRQSHISRKSIVISVLLAVFVRDVVAPCCLWK